MQIKSATAELLLATPGLTAITGTKIYRGGRMPRDQSLKPPFIVIWLLAKNPIYDHDGYSGLTDAVVQASCFSTDPDQADTMAALVRQALEGWPALTDDVDVARLEGETEGFEQNTGIHFVLLDFNISYHE